MTRTQIPDRRAAVTETIFYHTTTGGQIKMLVTFGLDAEHKRVIELFCADFKAGTDQHTLVMDVCVMLSLLMQHGYEPKNLLSRLAGVPRSLAGQLMEAAVKVEESL